MKTRIGLLLVALVALIFGACDTETPTAKIEVWLTDAPGDFEQVRIEVLDVQVHREPGEQSSGWLSMNAQPGLYDLLTLTNGNAALIGKMEFPAGKISQVRLKLSNRNSVKVGGEMYALRLPTAYQSGINVQINQIVQNGEHYKILLDFDVAQSVIEHGNGSYSMEPAIRSFRMGQGGSVKGSVSSAYASSVVYAILAGDTIASTYADATGGFLIQGLPEGTYTIGIAPRNGTPGAVVGNVSVQADRRTDIGSVAMIPDGHSQ